MTRVLLLAVLLSGLLLPAAARGAQPPDLPPTESLLFTLQADAGRLQPTATKGRFVLTLQRVASQGVWFSDRPARDTGAIAVAQLFGAWPRLGFADRPPNAVVSITGGGEQADMFAVELGRPRYDRRARTVRFGVRALSWLSHDLAHLGPSIDRAIPRRFGQVALFIDDATYPSSGSCDIVGEADLFAGPSLPAGYVAAGQTLATRTFPVLRSITDAQWGADDPVSFNLPPMPAPAGLQYGVCVRGMYPVDPGEGLPDVDPGCTPGEVAVQLADRPIAGWSALASIPTPPAGRWSLCARSAATAPCIVGQVALFDAPAPPANWIRADGGLVQIMSQPVLYNRITTSFGGDGEFTFATPNMPVPGAAMAWGICATGTYPTPA